jgi:hypothetical protein
MSCAEIRGDVGGGALGAVAERFLKEEEKIGERVRSYIKNYRQNYFIYESVGNSISISDTSLYDLHV